MQNSFIRLAAAAALTAGISNAAYASEDPTKATRLCQAAHDQWLEQRPAVLPAENIKALRKVCHKAPRDAAYWQCVIDKQNDGADFGAAGLSCDGQ